MNLFGIKIGRERRNQAPPGPTDDFWYSAIAALRSAAGMEVTPATVLRIAVVLSCVRVISETISTLPIKSMKKSGRTREDDDTSPIAEILRIGPNEHLSTTDWMERIVCELILRGEHISIIHGRQGVEITSIEPVHPDDIIKLEVKFVGGRRLLVYHIRDKETRAVKIYSQEEILHIRGLQIGDQRYRGSSVIQHAVASFGIGLAADNFAASTFKNQGIPAGILEYPEGLDEDEIKNITESWQKTYGGSDNAGKIAIIEQGLKYQKIGLTPADTQLLDTRKFTGIQLCGLLRVPPHKVAIMDKATWGNIEHQNIEFATDCIRPWAVKIERGLGQLYRYLGIATSRTDSLYVKIVTEGLYRGDINTRYSSYAVGRQWGWLSANDVREKEDMNPIGVEGDIYLVPLNMVPADKIDEVVAKPDPTTDPAATDKKPDPNVDDTPDPVDQQNSAPTIAEAREAISQLFASTFARVLRAEAKDVARAIAGCENGETVRVIQGLYQDSLEPKMKGILSDTCRTYAQQTALFARKDIRQIPIAELVVDTLDQFVAEYSETSRKEVLGVAYTSRDALPQLFEGWSRQRASAESARLMQRIETVVFRWEPKNVEANH